MRLHSSKLTTDDVRQALETAKEAGHVDRLVDFEVLDSRGSRTRTGAWEIRLAWYGEKVKGDGRRWTNTGNNGADTGGFYAATYDEWGWFIDALFNLDPELVFGHYKTREVFDTMTRYAYGD